MSCADESMSFGEWLGILSQYLEAEYPTTCDRMYEINSHQVKEVVSNMSYYAFVQNTPIPQAAGQIVDETRQFLGLPIMGDE